MMFVSINIVKALELLIFISLRMTLLCVIKVLGENPEACPCDEAKKYFYKSLMSISSEYTEDIDIKDL